jgi:hypothetical protein
MIDKEIQTKVISLFAPETRNKTIIGENMVKDSIWQEAPKGKNWLASALHEHVWFSTWQDARRWANSTYPPGSNDWSSVFIDNPDGLYFRRDEKRWYPAKHQEPEKADVSLAKMFEILRGDKAPEIGDDFLNKTVEIQGITYRGALPDMKMGDSLGLCSYDNGTSVFNVDVLDGDNKVIGTAQAYELDRINNFFSPENKYGKFTLKIDDKTLDAAKFMFRKEPGFLIANTQNQLDTIGPDEERPLVIIPTEFMLATRGCQFQEVPHLTCCPDKIMIYSAPYMAEPKEQQEIIRRLTAKKAGTPEEQRFISTIIAAAKEPEIPNTETLSRQSISRRR